MEKKYYLKHREKILVKMHEKLKDPEYRAKRLEWERRYFKSPHGKAVRLNYQKKWRTEIRLKALAAYGNKCACCGEDKKEFLTIDHINGNGRQHRLQTGVGTHFFEWLAKQKYPKDFQVLCYNCNCSKGHYGYCPHENKAE